jgi:septal ring factor EnvC (AmiA/AmiB activator)
VDYLQELGQVAGGAVAAFVTTWLALVRPLAGKVKQAPNLAALSDLQKELQGCKSQLDLAVQRLGTLESRVQELGRDVDRVEQKLGRTITNEEFQTYTQAMQTSLQSLAEKLGHATGSIEAWVRANSATR